MSWNLELAYYLSDAPWPSSKEELINFAKRIGAPAEVIENLQELNNEERYDSIEDIWYDHPKDDEDFYWNRDEYEMD
ncbi:DUF2795 domain-containing protein [Candidatus Shikimatogenerans silvanidophilus]|uniref:DUF2795 domain-containing protein n=1 Tax=Candidatus Shikimatogenerans silvanidophilus TaxID=2782547 RepID=UPI001BA7BB4B|nr:DUF2795 domain-containing protein [Candidatus Shikimatogenerans silvanidophilus]